MAVLCFTTLGVAIPQTIALCSRISTSFLYIRMVVHTFVRHFRRSPSFSRGDSFPFSTPCLKVAWAIWRLGYLTLPLFFQDGFFVRSFVRARDIRVALVGMESALVCTTYECDRCRGAIVCMRDCQKVGKVLIFTRKSGQARFSTPPLSIRKFSNVFLLVGHGQVSRD